MKSELTQWEKLRTLIYLAETTESSALMHAAKNEHGAVVAVAMVARGEEARALVRWAQGRDWREIVRERLEGFAERQADRQQKREKAQKRYFGQEARGASQR